MPARALFWEQGTGKSKACIDHLCAVYRAGKIDSAVVIAPNGVHRNWELEELPKHATVPIRAMSWVPGSASTKWHDRAFRELLAPGEGLRVLLMSYNGYMTTAGRKAAAKFVTAARGASLILDESQRIKSPSAKRTHALVAFAKRFDFKRLASGTPVTRAPFDVYPQIKALSESFWRSQGFDSFGAFKTYFGRWEERVGGNGQRFLSCVEYLNLDKLQSIVANVASRVLKSEALDLPPKIYTKRFFELSPEQDRAYKDLRNQLRAEIGGATVDALLAVTRLLRLQEIACGHLAGNDFPSNPRLAALQEVLEDAGDEPALIFARFTRDVDNICRALGPRAVRYDGQVSDAGRLEALERFRSGKAQYFVANTAAASTGLTLTEAATVVYYSNSFDLETRLQSEDRAHRIGQTRPVIYVDLIAEGTVDFKLAQSLRDKRKIAAMITGDELTQWI